MAQVDENAVPQILRCERCGRYCMSLELHRVLCAEEHDTKKGDARRRTPLPIVPSMQPKQHEWEERPATANWLREEQEENFQPPREPQEHLPCPSCGRRFVASRLAVHRRACAGQALPGFRAVVTALEANEREEELVLRERAHGEARAAEERSKADEQRARAEAAEAKLAAVESELEQALSKVERAEAAAKSMEAAYDVMAEAVEDGKKREAALLTRAEAAEKAVSGAESRAERAEAAAKSMEAAYDVMAEAVEDGKKRETALRDRAEAAEKAASGAGGTTHLE